jgi:3-hydroxyacyl-CoA dehydrogenase/enoyl-CoA hydratase/3-hydroxybutyryl-CoA epimerase
VVANADHIDAGVIFGTGFAPFRGGPLHHRKAEKAAAAATAAAA